MESQSNMNVSEMLEITKRFRKDDNGIWVPVAEHSAPISYPEDGNDQCFAIETDSFWFRHRNNIIGTLVDLFPPNGLFVDVGGGNGFVSLALQEQGLSVVLVEPGPKGAFNAKQRNIETVVCSTFEEISFAPRSVAGVGLFDVLEHIEDERPLLASINASLKYEGYLYITVPAHAVLWSVDDSMAGHYRRYTSKSIERLLWENGFEVEYATDFFSFLFLPLFFLRSIPSRLGIRQANDQQHLDTHRRRVTMEHRVESTISRKVLTYLCDHELSRIRKRKTCRVGTSCFVVARVR